MTRGAKSRAGAGAGVCAAGARGAAVAVCARASASCSPTGVDLLQRGTCGSWSRRAPWRLLVVGVNSDASVRR